MATGQQRPRGAPTTRTPSAPMPRRRSQSSRTRSALSSLGPSTITKSFPQPCILVNFNIAAQKRRLERDDLAPIGKLSINPFGSRLDLRAHEIANPLLAMVLDEVPLREKSSESSCLFHRSATLHDDDTRAGLHRKLSVVPKVRVVSGEDDHSLLPG